MFSHVMLGANDVEQSKRFYDAILGTLGYNPGVIDNKGRCVYLHPESVFVITKPINGEPATHGNGMTIGFKAANPDLVDQWHTAGLANGGIECEDPPGVRTNGQRSLYLAYLRDPAGNKLCAAHVMSSHR
ncbi:VOC family protein [Vibrio cincinnatiensis]|jgi:catechol 2,3-dioxygenase-like lactoylglutathione lyase family enzyme|uniref:Catechol 2,3-dioxygenase n=1 Tax=Vibrio cincinnatiensis DSM 19608 TaxID=1123491 RepID=A0A1T4KC49_VIBCI|nr:VOC family protein [Vibrio cincinnatiensis]SJZ39903.1 Catechol 2,3-dioxygenase [Vibrio cincinnatiensis DSM 19608]SUP48694.1 Lactoylglutathione lyase [Vibrio cincinnatiensis]